MRNVKLDEMVNDDGVWNRLLLSPWLPMNIISKIAVILPPDDGNGVDMQICKENVLETFQYQICIMHSVMDEWIAMNMVCTTDQNVDKDWSSFWAMAYHFCYRMADKIIQPTPKRKQVIVQVDWKPPNDGWVSLNSDGACKNGVIGCGGLIRGMY
ncbi:hypothetical protein KIW84_066023 [Lathyrus oleraceus]|uniref:RNase H type-1 domain-containing protein n=1 Tax=Pisum sativum TaxID=3888 RepID=A0A9D4WH02_PEA|nr:hypothetical protein KIW84_066023 [Pisum sativum]